MDHEHERNEKPSAQHDYYRSISSVMIPEVVTVSPKATVFEAAQKLTVHKIGAVMIVDGGKLVGVLSERDFVTRVASQGLNPLQTPVSEVMTRDLVTAKPGDSIADVLSSMRNRHIRHVPVMSPSGHIAGIVSIRDLLARVEENLRYLLNERDKDASLDPLTGIFNSRFFIDYLDAEIARSLRRGYLFCLIFMSPDTLHKGASSPAPESLLSFIQDFAQLLKPSDPGPGRFSIRRSDIAARIHEDTFVLILPETARQGAWTCAERLRMAAEQRQGTLEGRDVGLSASFGIVEFPSDGTRREDLVERAEQSLKAALAAGGNQLVSWDTLGD